MTSITQIQEKCVKKCLFSRKCKVELIFIKYVLLNIISIES